MKRILIFTAGVLVAAAGLLYGLQNDFFPTNVQAITQAAAAGEPARGAPATAAPTAPEPLAPPTAVALKATPSDTPPAETAAENLSPPEPTAPEPIATEAHTIAPTQAELLPMHPGALLIPVTGITAAQLQDTFNDTRGSERHHEALDIMAPVKTPVVAVDDGKVMKLFTSVPGGLTVYQYDPSASFAYYYAHLDSYAADLVEGQMLKRGDLIGYVGATGNANALAPHLHFAIFALGPEKQWWKGTAINPYPLFQR
jgi:murein DD-endopeptidase MepM/ murein hydrolase activator NlpD